MPEVWIHDNLSRHFMPRSDTVFQLFILLCSIVSFMFLFNWQRKITDFLEVQQISLEKSRYKAKCVIHSAKVQVQTNIQFVLWPFTSKTHSQPLSVNVGDDLELYIFFKRIAPIISHFFQRISLHLYTFPWNHHLYFIPVFIYTFIKVKSK